MSEASSSTPKPSASSSKPNQPSADDIERLLNREATAFQREIEVERILKAFKLKYVPPLRIYIDNLTVAVLCLFVCDRYTAHMRF